MSRISKSTKAEPGPPALTRSEESMGRSPRQPTLLTSLSEDVEDCDTPVLDEVEGSDDERDAFVTWPRRVREMAVDCEDPVHRCAAFGEEPNVEREESGA